MNTSITTEVLAAFLDCQYKAFLKVAGTPCTPSGFQRLETRLQQEFARHARQHLWGPLPADQVSDAPKSLAWALDREYPIITNAHVAVGNLSVRIDALVRLHKRSSREYTPVLFVHREKPVKQDKLLLAFWGLCLTRTQSCESRFGKIIYGNAFTPTSVRIDTLIPSVEHCLLDIASFFKSNASPQLRLNGHCSVCEFRQHCRDLAITKDDLSLLRTLKDQEITKLKAKGIFTTTQLSYTYRPRRRRKKAKKQSIKHHPSLQALAIRTDKIYVAQKPELPQRTPCVYLDIEGVPDREFYYLIGLRILDGKCHRDLSLWADGQDDERMIWESLLGALEKLDEFVLFHYGSYDSKAIGHLHKRCGGSEAVVKRLISSCTNVLSSVYGHVYFPTYSNDLKSIASCLGFSWSDAEASGLQSLVWRHRWETTHDDKYKKRLLTYNQEDCRALEVVTDALSTICDNGEVPCQSLSKETIDTETLVRGWPNMYKRNDFYLPAFDRINRCAYFDYQRERVLVRTSDLVRKSIQRKKRSRRRGKLNKTNECKRPSHCPHCMGVGVIQHASVAKTVNDLKLFNGGVKRWTVRHAAYRYLCKQCGKTFLPEEYPPSTWGLTINNLNNYLDK